MTDSLWNRRQWLGLCALFARAAEPAPDSRALVSTPARRAEYLQKMLRALCVDLGPRPAGSRDCEAGARIIEREMRRALPIVWVDTFAFTRWVLDGPSELQVGERRLETYVADNSPGTPSGGLQGVLKKRAGADAGYEVVDRTSGRALATLNLGPFGPATAGLAGKGADLPVFCAGRQDVPVLDAAVRDGAPVRVKAVVRWVPNVQTSNVVGTLPGASRQEMLLVAHADTKYNTVGASDNTASMIAMLMLAHGMSGTRPAHTVTFVATTGEEIGYLGAEHYARVRREKGTLRDVRFCLNLDSLTYGPNLQINTLDPGLAKMLLDIHRDLGLRSEPKVFQRNDGMDAAPFEPFARTVHFNSRGHDARTLPLNHRPDDTADTIDPELIENSYRVLMELVARLQKIPWGSP